LGSFGAAAAVFILAKTDTSKLIHCGVIAALLGLAVFVLPRRNIFYARSYHFCDCCVEKKRARIRWA
jgi:hypothetical protein